MEQALWDPRERGAARREFKAALYEMRLSSARYRQARNDHVAHGRQFFEVRLCREQWYVDLQEFIRSIIYLAEVETTLDLTSFLREADTLGELPESRQLDRAKSWLAECRKVVDLLFAAYVEAGGGVDPEKISGAWEEWGVALKRWGYALRNREEMRDRLFTQRKDGYDVDLSVHEKSPSSDASPGELTRTSLEWARRHVRQQVGRSEVSGPASGDPLPLGRKPEMILTFEVDARRYQLIVEGLITIVTLPGFLEARHLKKGRYVGLSFQRDIHYAKVRRVGAYHSVDSLISAEPLASLDPDRPSRQMQDQCHQQYVSYKLRHPDDDVRGMLAIELELPRSMRGR
ncbi:hypothetical protein Sme01_63770 [Sphaerisporangium melleum]|uniref:Uncharacterized protein n=1 Tax=Sphaerisporangium melleum TaxID=321316 RepID=A0A917VQV5_9ACTN|nr:hypothetical protein [Sphaerisporangium melleum]GGL05327.1 hypothetical protein GCM10007964_54440 [Sphaerisporangium melleum]GII73901.1 hypothetical protein Sme01_63770 [Sphaerisporangium melleum]